MKSVDAVRLFGMTHQLIESDLTAVEKRFSIDLGRDSNERSTLPDEDYYPQFEERLRKQAATMSRHFEVFYCLENSLRQTVKAKLTDDFGASWWNEAVAESVKKNAEDNMKRELDSGVTMRSTDALDYTTFGELGEIVRGKWENFSDIFNSKSAFNKIMASLNTLRAPIAHCCPLADDEIERLRLTLRDWFRLMG
jgi:Swt1-like HEPN